MMPKKALTPNQMWAVLVAVAGYVPVPLTGRDYLELLPVRWQTITASGIRIHHRTYDADLLAPHRGQASSVAGRGGKWEIHYNPHDVRQIWVRLPTASSPRSRGSTATTSTGPSTNAPGSTSEPSPSTEPR
ncbi:Mu transposase C-terminal domain-containing protein [Streptomyces sp. NTK 937]|uniref:Mu transposase C-terminal domain-containing protein n=1 Tax=Streptomyces sp. NTK 937 TaxID=1487711 RepID=UPI0004A94B1F|nr:Mu transposase C-terminal domain-containing protein [Streptomyces sp. NTK 937]KDQ65673.1 hypothetical protein DT87_30995 [Streptomyces sp. NTK 937]